MSDGAGVIRACGLTGRTLAGDCSLGRVDFPPQDPYAVSGPWLQELLMGQPQFLLPIPSQPTLSLAGSSQSSATPGLSRPVAGCQAWDF